LIIETPENSDSPLNSFNKQSQGRGKDGDRNETFRLHSQEVVMHSSRNEVTGVIQIRDF